MRSREHSTAERHHIRAAFSVNDRNSNDGHRLLEGMGNQQRGPAGRKVREHFECPVLPFHGLPTGPTGQEPGQECNAAGPIRREAGGPHLVIAVAA